MPKQRHIRRLYSRLYRRCQTLIMNINEMTSLDFSTSMFVTMVTKYYTINFVIVYVRMLSLFLIWVKLPIKHDELHAAANSAPFLVWDGCGGLPGWAPCSTQKHKKMILIVFFELSNPITEEYELSIWYQYLTTITIPLGSVHNYLGERGRGLGL